MKIDLERWYGELEMLLEKHLKADTQLSKDPSTFFDGFFCDAGFPVLPDIYPIWYHAGIVIYVEAMPPTRFDERVGRWIREGEGEYQRVFWVSDEGVFGEVSEENGRLTEFFPVSSPSVVADYFDLLRSKKLLGDTKPKRKGFCPSDLIENVYVRFFQYPDDLTENYDELPWVNLSAVENLVTEHIEKNIQWMSLPLADLKRLRLKHKTKHHDHKIEVKMDEDEKGIKITHSEFVLALFDAHHNEHQDLKKRCFEKASKLKVCDVLPPSATGRLVRSLFLRHFNGRYYDCEIDVGIELTEHNFCGFFEKEVNPQAFSAVTSVAFARLSKEFEASKELEVELPSAFDQKRVAFEVRYYRHQIHRQAQRLKNFDVGASPLPTADDLRKLLANRHEEVIYVAKQMPHANAELERAKHPLPFFLEAPFLASERSPEKLKVQNGLASFGNLIRIIVLLGLRELQSLRSNLNQFAPLPADIHLGITGNPSLGHWFRLVDYLGDRSDQLTIFQSWIRALVQRRKDCIELVEFRNKYVHPASAMDQAFLDDLIKKLDRFLEDASKELRRSSESLAVFLAKSRKAIRTGSGITFRIDGYDLASPYDCFKETSHEFSEKITKDFLEDEIVFVTKSPEKRWLSVNPFFRFREMRPGQCEISIYEKGFDGKTGIYTGISTGIQEKLPMNPEAFSI
jgi:hypothetical protein